MLAYIHYIILQCILTYQVFVFCFLLLFYSFFRFRILNRLIMATITCPRRRDKKLQQELVKAAGLRSVRQADPCAANRSRNDTTNNSMYDNTSTNTW